LGALINDHFDQHRFCIRSYRKLRKRLAANETARTVYLGYFRELRRAERNRPRLRIACREGIPQAVADYRESVVRISLSALAAIAFGQPSGGTRVDSRKSRAEEACLSRLFGLVMLIQICDDLRDWRGDWRAGLPTFATAELLQCAGQAAGGAADFARVRANVEKAAANYLAAASKQKGAFWPFVPCAYAVFLLVKLLGNLALRAPRKGTGPCFRPALRSPNTSSHRKMGMFQNGPTHLVPTLRRGNAISRRSRVAEVLTNVVPCTCVLDAGASARCVPTPERGNE
jgi:hypothetical protein